MVSPLCSDGLFGCNRTAAMGEHRLGGLLCKMEEHFPFDNNSYIVIAV